MKIDTIVLGEIEANCYCVREENSLQCLIVDPGMSPEPLIRFLEQEKLSPYMIVLTHGHVDHIAGVESLRHMWPKTQVAIHKNDAEMLTDPNLNFSVFVGTMVQTRPADIELGTEPFLNVAGLRFEIIHTPGHTQGGICLYSAKDALLFSGDTLFAGSVGRTDLPGGDHEQLITAIKEKLLTLPEQTKVYPGHGPATTIRNEKRHNSFLR